MARLAMEPGRLVSQHGVTTRSRIASSSHLLPHNLRLSSSRKGSCQLLKLARRGRPALGRRGRPARGRRYRTRGRWRGQAACAGGRRCRDAQPRPRSCAHGERLTQRANGRRGAPLRVCGSKMKMKQAAPEPSAACSSSRQCGKGIVQLETKGRVKLIRARERSPQ